MSGSPRDSRQRTAEVLKGLVVVGWMVAYVWVWNLVRTLEPS